MKHDLDGLAEEVRRLKADIRRLQGQAVTGNTSITKGRLRVASPEGLLVEGSAKVTGVLAGDGTFHWSGEIELVGPVTITGKVTRTGNETATGSTTFNGLTSVNGDLIVNSTSAMYVNGPLEVRGDTEVTGDLDVQGGGTIQAGAVTVSPASGGRVQVGSLTISSSGQIGDSNSDGVRIGTDFRTMGRVVLSSLPATSGVTPNLWVSGSGELFRVS